MQLSRRQVLAGLAATGLLGLSARAEDSFSIDAHNHVDVPLDGTAVPDLDLRGELGRAGFSAICMTFAVDYQPIQEPAQGYRRFLNGLSAMDAVLARNGMRRALRAEDLRAGYPTVIQSIEGAHFLEGRLERIEEAHGRGLRHFGLLHDHDAMPPLGDVFTNPEVFGGLTKLGAEAVRECNRLGMLLDMSHGSDKAVRDALKISTKPLIVSHTGLNTRLGSNEKMARMMLPRLIRSELAREVAGAGGVVGVWTHLADSAEEYAANVRAMVEVVGIDHVCIGTDSKLTADGRGRTNSGWASGGFYLVVAAALRKAGFSPAEIAKIAGLNYRRVFAAATA
jgi:membrane dipeptidase